jgi:hypothetical protein
MSDNGENPSTDALWVKYGKSTQTVASYLAEFMATQSTGLAKPLFWLEPGLQLNADNSSGRLKEFAPFCNTLPKSLPALEQAYVFARHFDLPLGLQVVACETGCRWFEFGTWQRPNCQQMAVNERRYPVLSRTDFTRFFGSDPARAIPKKFHAIEYWDDTGLLAWWLGDKD